ncbi:MAG: hypothetical protein KF842_12490 [Caulobacter sp.]|nr:hypothetical protein [Caulobacter sp.]
MIRFLACLTPALAPAFVLAACATPPAPASGGGAVAAKARPDCSEATAGRYWLGIGPMPARQGGELKVSVWKAGDYPGAETFIPAACVRDWKASEPGIEFASDGAGLRVGKSVRPGAVVEVSGAIGGGRAKASFTVIAADAVSLAGTWKEVGSADCPLTSPPLRELKFTAEGRFNVTWTPFETYVDYWGDYRFDPATGTLTMTTTGGNSVASDAILTGKAAVGADSLLTLTGIDFGRREGRPPATCLVFKR